MRGSAVVLAAATVGLLAAGAAWGAFPYPAPQVGSNPRNYTQYKLPAGVVPNEILQDDRAEWKFAATPEAGNEPVNSSPQELNGVRGASVADTDGSKATAFMLTTGRPDVTIATLDSGIDWSSVGDMTDMRRKTHLNQGELPVPLHDRTTSLEAGPKLCATYRDDYDANDDGVFDVTDYACDSRVEKSGAARQARTPKQPAGVSPDSLLDPQDVLIAFSSPGSWSGAGQDGDHNGFVDDIVGWDFLDDDNDPFDDVQYGHGTGEALDAAAESDNRTGNNGHSVSMCPNCMSMYLRVGDSFVADVDNFAQAAIYATDNGALVIQEALGTLNNSHLARQAVDYSYRHGVTTIASAADESAQHHNWPSSYPHVIVVNSVQKYHDGVAGPLGETPKSYISFNGCTNFSAKITVAIPSKECSSDATGKGGAMAGLIYSAALNARDNHDLQPNRDCRRPDGSFCVITPNEVRQAMASGTDGGQGMADDINFATQPEPACFPAPAPSCTNPMLLPGNWTFNYPLVPESRRFPSRKGHDQFYGWGRANMRRTIAAVQGGDIAPEAEIESPDWFAPIDPARASIDVTGHVGARGAPYSCRIEVAPGSYPNNASTSDTPPGDFSAIPSAQCDGTARTTSFDGVLGSVDVAALKARFPANATGFNGREPGIGTTQTSNGRPNIEPYGFVVRVVVTKARSGKSTLTGEDRRNFYLHRDQDLIPGFPKKLPSDGAASPVLVDLDGDNRNELVLATSDGVVHAYRSDGSELPGWPAEVDGLPLHTGDPNGAFAVGEANGSARDAILGSPAAADLDRDGVPEVVVADMHGKVYAFAADGQRLWTREIEVAYGGKPLDPFVDVRQGQRNRTQHAFIASPVLADLDGDKRLEVVAAAMDRHVYAWHDDGAPVDGYPQIVVDRDKVASIDPQTHAVTFNGNAGGGLDQGAIVDTPAVGDITGDSKPEVVVGTNEEYNAGEGNEPAMNLGRFNTASVAALSTAGVFNPANGRLYALKPQGDADRDPMTGDAIVSGWPFKVGLVLPGILPVVGEGITGAPIIGPVDCGSNGGSGPKVGVIADAGPGYIVNPDGNSCYGKDGGNDNGLQTDTPGGTGRYDTPSFPALGHPAFGNLGEGVALVAPAIGVKRALDLQGDEYQGGQDFVGAWNGATGQFRAGWPSPVNDLQFLTGPSVADVDGLPGEEVLEGTASLDLAALDTAGAPVNQKWPKLSTDWMVANPTIGSFGDRLDTAADARPKRVVAITRSGQLLAYDTSAPACSPGSWPRFHHDNANSGDYRRDAVAPGVPFEPHLTGGVVSWRTPGDDLLCGTIAAPGKLEAAQSDSPITARNFAAAEPLLAPAPGAPGDVQTLTLPASPKRYVAVRAVDEQGNPGRPVVIDRTAPPPPPGDTGGGGPGSGSGSPGGGAPGGAPGSGTPGGGGAAGGGGGSACRDVSAPRSAFAGRLSASRRGLSVSGTSTDRGCASGGRGLIRRVEVTVGRAVRGGCRFLTRRGLGARRACRRALRLRALTRTLTPGRTTWRLRLATPLPRGTYLVTARAIDTRGNVERPGPSRRFTVG
ncbi:MAG: hypothetical protein QOE65_2465 [Solirubrobacteraceae bacterium]|jgi:hypothetical protein|nr:hypothetical protein [Solirubrobacteraceae bacterium]